MVDKIITNLERKFGRYSGIRNLMTIIVLSMAAVYLSDFLFGSIYGFYLSDYLRFDRNAVFHGQIWRIITYVIVPPQESVVFILLHLLFTHFTGDLLQNHWGVLRFNLFYFFSLLCSVIAGFFTGYATSYFINLSLLLAVSILYPTMQVNIYGIIPLQMKWLAVIELVLVLPMLISGGWAIRIAFIVSLLSILIFFSDILLQKMRNAKRRRDWKKNWR